MERLTKTYKDNTHGVADNLPCGENSYTFKNLLIEHLGEYETLEEKGLLPKLPCAIGSTVYVLAECINVNRVLDGTMYGSGGSYGTATGWYCPYDLNDTCPYEDCECCEEAANKTAVFEDTVCGIYIDETGITLQCFHTNVSGSIGEYIFLTRDEAEAKLKESEV